MKTKPNKSYLDRLKKMKEAIDDSKELLNDEFPDDVTLSGNPELLDMKDSEIDHEEKDKKDNK